MRDIHPEHMRQLRYIAGRLADPSIEVGDHTLLTTRQKRIMEKYQGHSAPTAPRRGAAASQYRG